MEARVVVTDADGRGLVGARVRVFSLGQDLSESTSLLEPMNEVVTDAEGACTIAWTVGTSVGITAVHLTEGLSGYSEVCDGGAAVLVCKQGATISVTITDDRGELLREASLSVLGLPRWEQSSHERIGTISGRGLITGLAEGRYMIRAAFWGHEMSTEELRVVAGESHSVRLVLRRHPRIRFDVLREDGVLPERLILASGEAEQILERENDGLFSLHKVTRAWTFSLAAVDGAWRGAFVVREGEIAPGHDRLGNPSHLVLRKSVRLWGSCPVGWAGWAVVLRTSERPGSARLVTSVWRGVVDGRGQFAFETVSPEGVFAVTFLRHGSAVATRTGALSPDGVRLFLADAPLRSLLVHVVDGVGRGIPEARVAWRLEAEDVRSGERAISTGRLVEESVATTSSQGQVQMTVPVGIPVRVRIAAVAFCEVEHVVTESESGDVTIALGPLAHARGRVIDPDGQAASGAVVQVLTIGDRRSLGQSVTDGEGRFVVSFDGRYVSLVVLVTAPGAEAWETEYQVSTNSELSVELSRDARHQR